MLISRPVKRPGGPHHVLYLIDRLQSTAGGAEGVIEKLCRFLPSDRFRCSVATLWASDNVAERFSCPVHVFPLRNIYGWSALRCGINLSRLIRTQGVQIVHTFFPASDLWGGVVAKLSGCLIVISGRRDMGILQSSKYALPYRLLSGVFDQVQAVSERVRETCIAEHSVRPDKVLTVPNGIDVEAVDTATASDRATAFGCNPNSAVVITVANPRFVKGIDVLVRAAAAVRRVLPETLFVIVGQYPYETEYQADLHRLADELGVEEGIRFLGQRGDVFSLLKAADIFCLPSRTEGMSNALLEAMACGLPCVATDVGGNPEVVIEGETGFLVPSEQPNAVADKIIALLQNGNAARRMGERGRRVIESKFTVQHMIGRVTVLYEDLLRQRGLAGVAEPQQLCRSDEADGCFAPMKGRP